MIADFIQNAALYAALHPRFPEAFIWLSEGSTSSLPEEISCSHQNMTTQADPQTEGRYFEAHRQHIDIHFIIKGSEIIECCPLSSLLSPFPYQQKKDALLAPNALFPTQLFLSAGMFAVFFPEDAHRPGKRSPADETVEKLVLKVKLI